MSNRLTTGGHVGDGEVARLARRGQLRPQVEARAIRSVHGPDVFRLGVAIIGLTAYLALPTALVVWLLSVA